MTSLSPAATRPAPTWRVRASAMLLAVLLAVAALIASSSSPAFAASRVDVDVTPSADGSTTVTLSGSGFQYLPNAPGGVYVFFGTVTDPTTNAWAPSQGGKSGTTFSYAATDGSQLLVAFAGGSSAEAANATIGADGSWTARMTIPGSSFASTFGDPHSGNAQAGGEVDCLEVMCGIITIGAHGNWNANNESFTPVSFVTADGEVRGGTERPSFTDEATVVDIPAAEESPAAQESPAATAPAQDDAADAVPATQAPVAEDGQGMTPVVLGVLGFAVAALLAAVVVFFVRRAGERRRPAPAATGEGSGAATPGQDGQTEGQS
ncbi:hypothetical protein [Microbacterium tumbae]